MSLKDKYFVVAASSCEDHNHHRLIIKERLERIDLSPDLRRELEEEFERTTKEEHLRDNGTDDEGSGGSRGKTGSSGKQGGGGGGGGGREESTGPDDDGTHFVNQTSNLESIALLFYRNEQMIDQLQAATGISPVTGPALLARSAPVTAATLLYNSNAAVAQVREPYLVNTTTPLDPARDVLPTLEQHAVSLGVREMQLQVHANMAAMFQRDFGYQPQGSITYRNGVPMQKMIKCLTPVIFPTNTIL